MSASKHIKTLRRRADFLYSRGSNSYDKAELAALEWALHLLQQPKLESARVFTDGGAWVNSAEYNESATTTEIESNHVD